MVRRSFLSIFEHGRTADLLGATVLAWFAICLTFPGDTLANQGFKTFRIMGLDEIMIAVPLAIVATLRIVALIINGAWRRTPLLRAIGACIGAGIFGSMGMAFGWPYIEAWIKLIRTSPNWDTILVNMHHLPGASTGAATYTVLALFELISAARAGADIRIAKK